MKTFDIPVFEFSKFDTVDILTASGYETKGKKGFSELDELKILGGEYDDDLGDLTWIKEAPVER